MMQMEVAYALKVVQTKHERDDAQRQNARIQKGLRTLADSMGEYITPKYTGWFVLLRHNDDARSGYEYVGIFNPDTCRDDEEPEWDVALPITTPETTEEFLGW